MSNEKTFWDDFARRHEGEWSRTLSQLLQYDTVSGDPDPAAYRQWRDKITQGFAFLHDFAKSKGFVTRNYEDRVLVVEAPGPANAPVLGFPIHLDVVPAGEGWTRDPFGGETAQGAIWGRGAQDDKGPIVQVLFGLMAAVEMARQRSGGFKQTVRVIVVSEEECGIWDDIPYYFSKEQPPDFSIVPDAEFPITNGEKGILNLKLDFEWTPRLAGLFQINSGERPNVVPSKAKLEAGLEIAKDISVLQELTNNLKVAPKPSTISHTTNGTEVLFHGTGSHGSLPHKGYNAATDALKIAARLPGLSGHPAVAVLDWLAKVSASIDGSFLGINHYHEKVGKTTVNLGVLRVGPSGVHAVLNIRNPIGLTGSEVERRVREAAEKMAAMTGGPSKVVVAVEPGNREPIYIDPDRFAAWINPMREAYQAVTHREPTLQSIGGTTFAKAFPNAVCFGPVDPNDETELAHEADEHVTLAAMRRNVEIYGRAIIGIAL